MHRFITILSVFLSIACSGQQEKKESPIVFTGYVEIYYQKDFNKPADHTRPDFVYSYNRANEFNLNMGFLKAAYETTKVRANLAFMAGTYVNANLSDEPEGLKNLFEANAGVKLSEKKNVWIDAGIFASHIGFESAIGKDCWNLTRSILADNSPYYETGVKVSYTTDNGKWFLSGLILNGWQRIRMVNGNSLPSFGTQVTFKPKASVSINYSSFLGADKPDSARLMRYFNNLYWIFQLSETAGLTIGLDYGFEEKYLNKNGFNTWYAPVAILQLRLGRKVTSAFRAEYYDDRHGVIVESSKSMGLKVTGISVNWDYQIYPNALWRIEGKYFTGQKPIFLRNGRPVDDNASITASLALSF